MIFYFSGTGNTRWIAQQLAEATDEKLLFIPDEMKKGMMRYKLKAGERLGFCFPTHGWQPPRIVREFIRKAQFVNGNTDCTNNTDVKTNTDCTNFVWALTTCGDNMGKAMDILNRELTKKGLKAETLFSVIMPESYVCLPFMYTDTESREREKIEQARRQTEHMARIIRDRKRDIKELDQGATPRLFSYVIGQYFNKHMITDKKFTVDEDVCTRCGKCRKMCPVDNITGTPPHWLHNGRCTCCLACYHYCPVHAINYGSITKKRDQYYFNRREDRK
jgi:ferredoxin